MDEVGGDVPKILGGDDVIRDVHLKVHLVHSNL